MLLRIPAYSRNVKLVFDNRIDPKVIMSTDVSMNEEDYFNYVKNELGLKVAVYLVRNMLMHVEAVQICFTVFHLRPG